MVSSALLLALLLVSTYTDVRWRIIYNWNTYPGILVALGGNLVGSLLTLDPRIWGVVGFYDSLLGFLACSGIMLICFVFFAGGIGGGDIKLLAMTGAFLGLSKGFEVMLWTFVLGGCLAMIVLVWRIGAWELLRHGMRYVWLCLRTGRPVALSEEERAPLKTDMYLSPSALAAVLIVQSGIF
jgi:prepilin peptidase CpaA